MTARKQHANGRAGLWQDTPDQPYVPATDLPPELATSPRRNPCPHCHANPGEPCTRPARGGRKDLHGYHDSRLNPSSAGIPPVQASDQEKQT